MESSLSEYRVLDLTDEKGYFCGKILGDLGADVIKIERPGGDLGRRVGPFYKDECHPEKSLFWLTYNTSKRGITLNIETADGKAIFLELLKIIWGDRIVIVEATYPRSGYESCGEVSDLSCSPT
jgi:crotonobetainyl-CoA:carnitine CoA-transferase CaiB-like acyl-CoA transferase